MYYKVPMANGVLDINYETLIEARTLNLIEAVVLLQNAEKKETWAEITEAEYLAAFGGCRLQVDKTTITADGLDTATVTADAFPGLTEITFYHADTGKVISTMPVDPAIHTATLQVTATTPGVIRIRTGEPTITQLNEVVINAT